MRQLTYVSTVRGELLTEAVKSIERHAQQSNAAQGLSGLSLFDGVRFLQILEGDADRIESTLDRIRGDRRHFGIVILADKTVERGQFGG